MIYLDSFRFPTFEQEDDYLAGYFAANPYSMNVLYPFKVLSVKGLHLLDFSEITILYGGNGSGKSTALNAISNVLGVARNSAYNKGDNEFYEEYLNMCDYQESESDDYMLDLKDKTSLITSDDIFKYMLNARQNNSYIRAYRDETIEKWITERKGKVRHLNFETGEGLDEFNRFQRAKRQSCSEYVNEHLGAISQSYSNGETGFMKFVESITPNRLYILDEPENSLSCALQMELAKYIEQSARYFGCQFIIATHSPFLLAIERAKIYNLDGDPATISKFWELPNMKLYYDLFKGYEGKFE